MDGKARDPQALPVGPITDAEKTAYSLIQRMRRSRVARGAGRVWDALSVLDILDVFFGW